MEALSLLLPLQRLIMGILHTPYLIIQVISLRTAFLRKIVRRIIVDPFRSLSPEMAGDR